MLATLWQSTLPGANGGAQVSGDFMLEMALNHFEFDEPTKARIRAVIPKAAYVADLLKHNKTVLNELMDVFNIVAAQVAKKESQ